MEYKNFWPTVLAVITAIVIALVIARVARLAMRKRNGTRQPGQRRNVWGGVPAQAQIQQQPIYNTMQAQVVPQSFQATNSIPQQNMPYDYTAN